ncbi:MAG: hypothetical protein ACLS6W_06945 [Ruminococcus sp.]
MTFINTGRTWGNVDQNCEQLADGLSVAAEQKSFIATKFCSINK